MADKAEQLAFLNNSYEQAKSMFDELIRCKERLAELCADEDLLPDYSTSGVQALHDAIVNAATASQSASTLHSRAAQIMGFLRAVEQQTKEVYNRAYDIVSADIPLNNQPGISWEERASRNRVKVVDLEMAVSPIKLLLLQAEGAWQAIEILSWGFYRRRGDYTPLLDTLKFGQQLSEL